jgi:ATP-dependent Clp protease ATP-binding subunit ClpB
MIQPFEAFAAATRLAARSTDTIAATTNDLHTRVNSGALNVDAAVQQMLSGPVVDARKGAFYLEIARTAVREHAADGADKAALGQLDATLASGRDRLIKIADSLTTYGKQGQVPDIGGGLVDEADGFITTAAAADSNLFEVKQVEDKDLWESLAVNAAAQNEYKNLKIEQGDAGTAINALYAEGKKGVARGDAATEGASEALAKLEAFGGDMVALARANKETAKPLIGRDEEIRRVMEVLGQAEKNNPVLVGEAGVGKTAIVEGFARRIADGDVPADLLDAKMYALDYGKLSADGSAAQGFRAAIDAVKQARSEGENVVVFIDEIHQVMNDKQVADILKPAMARGEFPTIGATTLDEFRAIEKDPALERRLGSITVEQPDLNETKSIARGVRDYYERHHTVAISEDALDAAAELSNRYMKDKQQPDKTLSLLDQASREKRITLDTKPRELDMLERKIGQLQRELIELEADTTGVVAKRTEEVREELVTLSIEARGLRRGWEQYARATNLRADISKQMHDLLDQATKAEEAADYGTAAAIRYEQVPPLAAERDALSGRIAAMRVDNPQLPANEVTASDIKNVVSRVKKIDVSQLDADDSEKYLNLESLIGARVVGQDEAISQIAEVVRLTKAGMDDPNRTRGVFILLGGSGVGKTELAKATAEIVYGDKAALIRTDMSGFQEPHSVSRLIGSPPGYVGSDKGGQVTEAVRRRPESVNLWDEGEKAHPEVWKQLLPLFDEGRLQDAQGKVTDFTNTIQIVTGNIGLKHLKGQTKLTPEIIEKVKAEVERYWPPEFLGRVDSIIVMNPHTPDTLRQVVEIHMKPVMERVAAKDAELEITDAAMDLIAATKYQPEYGARPVKNNIKLMVSRPLSEMVLRGELKAGQVVKVDVDEAGRTLTFETRAIGEPAPADRKVTVDTDAVMKETAPPKRPTDELDDDVDPYHLPSSSTGPDPVPQPIKL